MWCWRLRLRWSIMTPYPASWLVMPLKSEASSGMPNSLDIAHTIRILTQHDYRNKSEDSFNTKIKLHFGELVLELLDFHEF